MDDLDTQLNSLRVPLPASNLAHRIIDATRPAPSKPAASPWAEVWGAFLFPRPAYAMACFAAIGLLLGAQFTPVLDMMTLSEQSSFLYDDGAWL